MNKSNAGAFIVAIGGTVTPGTFAKTWGHISCPFAEWRHEHGTDRHPSFGIEIKPNAESRTHCLSCNFSGNLHDVILELRMHRDELDGSVDLKRAMELVSNELDDSDIESLEDIGDYEDTETKQFRKPYLFPEEWLASFKPVEMSPEAVKYCRKRRVMTATQGALDLRWDGKRRRVCFPVRDDQGRLRGFHGRSIDPKPDLPYLMYTHAGKSNPEVWLGEAWIDYDEPLVLVESVFDLATVYPIYRNVATPLTASLNTPKIRRVADAIEIVLLFDADKAGDNAADKVRSTLRELGVRTQSINLKRGCDPGDLTHSELAEILEDYLDI